MSDKKDETWQQIAWDVFKVLLITLAVVIGISLVIFALIFFLAKSLIETICASTIIQIALAVVPIILEIVGVALTVTGIGAVAGLPVAGIGMFMEVASIICDLASGDIFSLILGLLGLIPLGGLPFNFAKGIRKIF